MNYVQELLEEQKELLTEEMRFAEGEELEQTNQRMTDVVDALNKLNIGVVTNRTFTKRQKVKVLVGCVWQNAEVEDYHPDPKYYLCGTNSWSTHFHENSIKAI